MISRGVTLSSHLIYELIILLAQRFPVKFGRGTLRDPLKFGGTPKLNSFLLIHCAEGVALFQIFQSGVGVFLVE